MFTFAISQFRNFAIVVFSFFVWKNSFSQSIVNNGSFETTILPPICPLGIFFPTDWYNAAIPPVDGFGSTPEVVCPTGNSFAPAPPFSPFSGDAAFGLLGLPGSNTEAVRTDLTSTANAGDTIKIAISVYSGSVLGTGVDHPSLVFGIYFYNTGSVPEAGSGTLISNPFPGIQQHLTATPQVVIPGSSIVVNSWTTFSLSYVAPTTISKMAIGFFRPGSAAAVTGTGGYYVIDGVGVTLASPSACGSCSTPTPPTSATYTWTGCVDTDWFDPCNWDTGTVPTAAKNVIIPNVTNDPLITGATANCFDITVQAGAIVNLNSGSGGWLNVTKP